MLSAFRQAVVLAVVHSVVLAAGTPSPSPTPRHAVVLLIDDLGYGDTGHMGAEFATPAIDALALGGIRLNQSYSMQLCSPTRSSLLTSRYAYNIAMDGNVLISGDARCIPTNMTTVGDQMQRNGVATAFIGKYDAGYSSWACTPNCRGFDYWLGYYGAAEDYYLHGSPAGLDFHENYNQAPQYRQEYSTILFTRKAQAWIANATNANATAQTYLHLAFQAVHGPIEMPPGPLGADCRKITETTRQTYCAMVQTLDAGIANLTATYKQLGIFDDTVWLFLSDNGGTNQDGGFNVPLRGQKATIWEGGVRSQTFMHWTGFAASRKGSVYGGLAHVSDWGVTMTSALGHTAKPNHGQPALDGVDLWPAVVSGGASPRTEMLLSMRDADLCPDTEPGCVFRGELAYRKGAYKLMYGHTALRGKQGETCSWDDTATYMAATGGWHGADVGSAEVTGVGGGTGLNCWNGWGRPRDVGPSKPPPALPAQPGQPANSSGYDWGAILLFDIENDPLEEHDLSARFPKLVQEMLAALVAFNDTHIDQGVEKTSGAETTETCGNDLKCAVPWLPSVPGDRCEAAPTPPPPPPPPPGPGPSPHGALKSHLTLPDKWKVSATSIELQGWACFVDQPPQIALVLDGASPVNVTAISIGISSVCGANISMGRFNAVLRGAGLGTAKHTVAGEVVYSGGARGSAALGDTPACIDNGKPAKC